jgi:hypothetical protein
MYAVSYIGPDTDGFVATFTISQAGEISDAIIDSREFNLTDIGKPFILHVSTTCFLICFYYPEYNASIITFRISNAGAISITNIDSFSLSLDFVAEHRVCYVSGDVYLISHPDSSNAGVLLTVGIETLLPGLPRHELIMGIG